MRRRQFLRAARAAGVAAVAASAGCSTEGATPTESTPTARPDGDVTMTIAGDGEYYFDPIGLYVEPGETVTWVNGDGIHSTASFTDEFGRPVSERRIPEDAEGWYSGPLTETGATAAYTFETEGTYDYYCNEHKAFGMVGRIVVGEPGGPAEGTRTEYGEVPPAEDVVERGAVSFAEFDG